MALSFTAPRFEVEALEQEINELSEEEKERLLRDIYGDGTMITEETPKLIAESLAQLQKELSNIKDKETYARAQEECSDYVNSHEFLLQFLRTELFDAKKAAQRIVGYWEQKILSFGEERTFGPITIDQLEETDLRVLKEALYLLPKDNFGRVVVHVDRGAFNVQENGRRSVIRALFYLVHVSVWGDVSAQQKGMVFISSTNIAFHMNQFDRILMRDSFKMCNLNPSRVVANHLIHHDSLVNFVVPALLWLMGPEARKRFRIHHNTCNKGVHEYFEKLGLKPSGLPSSCGGNFRFDGEAWIRKRREIEARPGS